MERTQLGAVCLARTLVVAYLAFGAPTSAQRLSEPLTFSLHGDRLEYSIDKRRAILTGNVRGVLYSPGYATGRAAIRADRMEVEVGQGAITTHDGKVLVGPALLAGDEMLFDTSKSELAIKQARGYMALSPASGGAVPTVYFSGKEITKVGDNIYLRRGRVTTCDRQRPHYYIFAKRMRFELDTERLVVYDAGVRLYGLKMPLLPQGKTRFGGGGEQRWFDPSVPGYSSREGVYVPVALRLADADAPWATRASVRVTAKQGITGAIWTKHETNDWDIEARASRREWVADKITDRVCLYRLPELTFARHFSERNDPDALLKLDLSFGNFKEDLASERPGEPQRPVVRERRALATLSYVANARQCQQRLGNWYGATGRVSTYSSNDTYSDLELFAGLGGHVTSDLTAHATLRHHITSGTTPFLFDDVDIRTELLAGAAWQFTDKWGVEGWGRYDLDETDMRDYEIGLSFRAHCLTWGLYYRDVGSRIGLRVDLTGLTGGTRPYRSCSALQRQMEQEGLFVAPWVEGGGETRIREEESGRAQPHRDGLGGNTETDSDKEM